MRGVGSGQGGHGRRGLRGQDGRLLHHLCRGRPRQEAAQAAQKAPDAADPVTILIVNLIF